MLNNISILTEEQLDDAVELVIDELIDLCDPSDVDDLFVGLAAEQVGVMSSPQLVSAVMARIDRIE